MHTASFDEVGHQKPKGTKFNEPLWTIVKQVYIDSCYKTPSMDSTCWGAVSKIARKLGINRDCLSSWINGRKPIPEKHVENLASLSNGKVKPDELRANGPILKIDVSRRIKKLMEDNELNLTQFSRKVGGPYAELSKVISGKRKPTLLMAVKIMKAFGLKDIYDLVEIEG